MPELKPSENLTPLALFGMIIVGSLAISVANICTVAEHGPDDEYSDTHYYIEMSSGQTTVLSGADAVAFRDQLQTMMRHAQFAAPAGGSLIKH